MLSRQQARRDCKMMRWRTIDWMLLGGAETRHYRAVPGRSIAIDVTTKVAGARRQIWNQKRKRSAKNYCAGAILIQGAAVDKVQLSFTGNISSWIYNWTLTIEPGCLHGEQAQGRFIPGVECLLHIRCKRPEWYWKASVVRFYFDKSVVCCWMFLNGEVFKLIFKRWARSESEQSLK